MPRFEPFPGLRYADTHDLADVTAPPYDVIDRAERAAARSAATRTTRSASISRSPAPPSAGTGSTEAGATATTIPTTRPPPPSQRWQADGVLHRDPPSFYVYRMDYLDETGAARHTTGVIGALQLSRPGEGGILPHEHTTKKAKSDRLDLQRATRANLSAGVGPVAGRRASPTCSTTTGRPLATWTDGDGVAHSLWVVDDDARIGAIRDAVGGAPGRDRRRAPPVRDRPGLPGRAPGHQRRQRRSPRLRHVPGRRAGRRPADRGAHPPPAQRASRRLRPDRRPRAVLRDRAAADARPTSIPASSTP